MKWSDKKCLRQTGEEGYSPSLMRAEDPLQFVGTHLSTNTNKIHTCKTCYICTLQAHMSTKYTLLIHLKINNTINVQINFSCKIVVI